MDEGPNPGKNEEPGARLDVFRRLDEKKKMPGPSPGSWLKML
jgi:hypothetical protein